MRRRALLAALAALTLALLTGAALTGAAQAQSQPATAFLRELYEPYKDPTFKGQPYWEAKRFFVADLTQAIERDFAQAKKRNEVPQLDGDPFIDAQDWKISSISYAVTQMAGRAGAVVAFDNLGKPTLIAVFLVETPQGWRIDDIVSRGSSLRALYKLR